MSTDATTLVENQDSQSAAAPEPGDPVVSDEVVALDRPYDPRKEARDSIYAKRSQQLQALNDDPSLQAVAEAAGEALPEDQQQDSAHSPRADEGEAAGADAGSRAVAPASAAEPERVTIKVDGQVREVAAAELHNADAIRQYQINAAAQARLQEAAETLRRAQAIEAQAKAQLSAVKNSQGQQLPSGGAGSDAGAGAPAQEVMEALMRGEVSEFSEALARAIKTATGPRVEEDTAPSGTQPIAAPPAAAAASNPLRTPESIRLANYVFANEFKDVHDNDAAWSAAEAAMRERLDDPRNAGVPLDLLARDVGFAVRRQHAAVLAPTTEVSSVQRTLQQRNDVKQRLPRVTTAASAAPPEVSEATQQSSRSSYVDQLRARSGTNSVLRSIPRR